MQHHHSTALVFWLRSLFKLINWQKSLIITLEAAGVALYRKLEKFYLIAVAMCCIPCPDPCSTSSAKYPPTLYCMRYKYVERQLLQCKCSKDLKTICLVAWGKAFWRRQNPSPQRGRLPSRGIAGAWPGLNGSRTC